MNPKPGPQSQSYRDVSFIYAFDADSLSDGTDYADLNVPVVGDSDFVCRKIMGRPLVAQQIRYYDERNWSKSSALFEMLGEHLILPEITFPADGQIRFDLGTVARASWVYTTPGSVPNYYSQLAFQGVRRYWGGPPERDSDYPYRRAPFSVQTEVSVDWTGRIAPAYQDLASPVQFTVPVQDVDFELTHIAVLIAKGRGNIVPVESRYAVKLMLYDNAGMQLSNVPVLDQWLAWNSSSYNSCFPVPSVLYPANSQIKFDVTSLLLDTEIPATLTLVFHGFRHYPLC